MLDDSNEDAQRQFRRQVDDDVANWISQLDSDTGSGVPPPPEIKVSEVSSQSVEFDLINFGAQGAETQPSGAGGGGGGGDVWACCQSDEDCSEMSAADCEDAGGDWFPGQTCDDDPCDGACCDGEGGCLDLSEFDCTGTFMGIGTSCADDPPPCEMPDCLCGFPAFDGSGRMFLTKTIVRSDESPPCCEGLDTCAAGHSGTQTIVLTYDPITCELSDDRDKITATDCDGSTGEIDATACGSLTVDDATHAHCHNVNPLGPPCSEACPPQGGAPNEVTLDETQTLSDECNPI